MLERIWEAISFSLHGQSPVCATGPNPAAEASVLCGSDAYILQLFSEPSSPLLASWVQFWLKLCLPPSLASCGSEVHWRWGEDQVSKGQVLLRQEGRKAQNVNSPALRF